MFCGEVVLNNTPFRYSLDLGRVQLALLILDAGHNLAVEEYLWSEVVEETPEGNGVVLPHCLRDSPELMVWLRQEFEADMSLKRMCKSVIRLAMAETLANMQKSSEYKDLLPLPRWLLDFVIMPEFSMA